MSESTNLKAWYVNALNGALFVAAVALGITIGRNSQDGLVGYLQEKNSDLEGQVVRLQSEINSFGTVPAEVPPETSGQEGANPTSQDTLPEVVTLSAGTSASISNGSLTISLIAISFEGSPLRHRVVAAIGSPGQESITLDRADIGDSVRLGQFEVIVRSASTFSASFWIRDVSSD